jgi:hypothetical protein
MAEVECEDLTATEFAVLAPIVEINESGQLGSSDALCRKTRLSESVVKVSWNFRGNDPRRNRSQERCTKSGDTMVSRLARHRARRPVVTDDPLCCRRRHAMAGRLLSTLSDQPSYRHSDD